jgi:amino acid transporter
LPRELGLRDLALFNIAAVVSIRWLAAAAHIGPGSLLLWAGATVLFFVPLALAVATLSARFPEEGGIYAWTGHSFGEWHGFLCGWCYWLSNLFYFPNLLVAGIGMGFHAFGGGQAALSDSPLAVVTASLSVLWLALLTNLVGLRVGKWTQNLGALATCALGAGLLSAGALVFARHGAATPLSGMPEWNWDTLNLSPQIAFAFGGLELGAIMSGEIRDPRRTVRRAAWISGVLIAAFYMLGTLAMLALLPPDRVSIVTGLAQAAETAAQRFGIPWIAPAAGVLIALGILGQFGAWVGGSARLAFVVGLDRYLPAPFARLHPRWRTPHVALLAQGAACTLFVAAMQAGESLHAGYQLLVDMTVITYFIPFLYLFAAAGKQGQRWSGTAGLLVATAGIVFSFVPPAGVRSVWLFEAKLAGSCVLLILAARIFFRRRRLLSRG